MTTTASSARRHTVDCPAAFVARSSVGTQTQALLDSKPLDCLALFADLKGEQLQPAVSAACISLMRSTVVLGDLRLWMGAHFYVV